MFRVLVIALALAGCKDKQLQRLTAIKQEVCACKTSACAETAMQKVPQSEIKSSTKTQAVARQMMDCLKKLYDNETLDTDPDADATSSETPPPSATPTPSSAKTP